MKFRLQFRRYRLPFRVPVRTAHGLWSEREGLIVRLTADPHSNSSEAAGLAGFGEAAPVPHFGPETADDDELACEALGEWLEEEALEQIPLQLACLRNAVANARAEVHAARDFRVGKVSSPTRDAGEALAVAALLPAERAALPLIPPRADLGFRVFKWKVGVGDLGDELGLLDDVCAALPSGAKLRLDANGAWDRRRAERWLERCADRPVEFVEQPIAADARGAEDLLLGLAGDYPTPLALDESIVGEGDIERWLGLGWPGVFVVKPALIGDLASALAKLEKAKAGVVFSSALETAVGARAALRCAFAWQGERRALGFGVWPLFAQARFDALPAVPFVRSSDVERLDPESIWTALS